ncbi:helix-turn-helix domain-containing protein [Sandaracinus amylolyticus]|uniref:helix-turn-helix domain-containing protein n=1 Tax=Sandaracinus amylolyticus TaxID=927083 RepID=UPI001F30C279|nr:helix-turn-helix transcriptional regulator [Sandaracinus amylolyticus]
MPGSTMGVRIERARELAGLNKNQLARAVGTSWQHVDHWERDRTQPSPTSLSRLASVLGVTLAYLLGEEEPVVPPLQEALETFLRSYAPPDLTPQETAWLRAAPIDPALATPGTYLDLLHRIRMPRPASTIPPAPAADDEEPSRNKTGRRAKVRMEDVLARVKGRR